ncbi:uncharacterized protein LOC135196193 [Macrobrachium nipponense]|uniref:uncharacterized protein LOC135196193 n=1 Tax=Macrobrachium nipponense TaxID=159736 RepID=UPI0030C7AB45
MSYQCGLCKKDYSSIKRLEKHKCSFCFFCQRSYSTKQKYDSHSCAGKNAKEILSVGFENPGISSHVCEWCKKGFSSLNYLAAHKCPYCAVCDHIFASYQKYEMHKRKCARLHSSADLEPVDSLPPPEPTSTPVITDHKCELCKKYFSSPKYLATHKCAYCRPCRRSFATFQKFRMHRLKCTRVNHSSENNSDLGTADEVINNNSLQEVVAARGNFITRKVISHMAMLELIRRMSGLSSMIDLIDHSGPSLTKTHDVNERPENLTHKPGSLINLLDTSEQDNFQCFGGESTNFILSRLSLSRNSPENDRESDVGSVDIEDGQDNKSVTSLDFDNANSDEVIDQKKLDFLDNSMDNIGDHSVSQKEAEEHRQSPKYKEKHFEQFSVDDKIGATSPYVNEWMRLERSPSESEHTVDHSLCDERTDHYNVNEGDRLLNFSVCDDESAGVRFSSMSSDCKISRLPENPKEKFDVYSKTAPSFHHPNPESSELLPLEEIEPARLDQNVVFAQLVAAIRSQFLLSAGSHKSSYFLDDSQDSSDNQIKEWISEMPRAKLIDSKPRGRMSAYAFFVQTCREEHKKKHPDENVVFSEFSRKCADRWKTMTDKEKIRFYEMAEKDKDRYESEMKGYRGPRMPRGSRKRRNRKDPNAPKRALSAFFWFCNDERPKVRAANPDMGVGEIAKQLGAAWSNTSSEVKSKYEAMAEYDKARYEREMKAFKEGNFAAKKQKTVDTPDEDDEEESESEEDEEEEEEVE